MSSGQGNECQSKKPTLLILQALVGWWVCAGHLQPTVPKCSDCWEDTGCSIIGVAKSLRQEQKAKSRGHLETGQGLCLQERVFFPLAGKSPGIRATPQLFPKPSLRPLGERDCIVPLKLVCMSPGDLTHHNLPPAKPQLAYNMKVLALVTWRGEEKLAEPSSLHYMRSLFGEAQRRLFCPKAAQANMEVKKHNGPNRSLLLPWGRCDC